MIMTRKSGDCFFARPSVSELKKVGVTFVCRHLSHNPKKDLMINEAEDLSAVGIDIVSTWEDTATRASEVTMRVSRTRKPPLRSSAADGG
jgi:hypothetical protein